MERADDLPAGAPLAAMPPPSVLRGLNAAQRRLDELLHGGDTEAHRGVARELLRTTDLSHDVALACVVRNQVGGSHALRHSVETAVVAALAARHLRVRPAHLLALTCAALALHRAGRPEGVPAQRPGRAEEQQWFARLLAEHAPEQPPDDAVVTAGAHLLRMADRYCAGISARNYRRSLRPDDALDRVLAEAPDALLADAFRAEIGPYPPGTLVRLTDGSTAVVTHRDGGRAEVLCLADDAGRQLAVALPRRVGDAGCAIAHALGDDDCDVRVPMKQVWGPLAAL